jgi:cardiolipin synthase
MASRSQRRRRRGGTHGGVPVPVIDPPSQALAAQLPPVLAPYARTLQRWRPGCTATVLPDGGTTFPAMLAAIGAATRSVCLETYILVADRVGMDFQDALVERAVAGVAVRLLYDAVGAFGLPAAYLAELRAAGVEIVEYNPIAPWRRRFKLAHRDHRKILVVDDEVAFTGGLNIASDYDALANGGAGWHDMHCRLRGSIVIDLARMFRRTWLRAGGSRYPSPSMPTVTAPAAATGSAFIRLIDNARRRQRTSIRRAYVHVIRAARETVWIENAYFLPDRGLRRALIDAAKRGVDVQVLTPGHSDVRLVGFATTYVARRLARRGVHVRLWRGPMMHAKTAVVDGTWSTIGSYNFDAQSRFNNLEATVEILDPGVAGTLVAQFQTDLANTDEFTETSWTSLSWWRRALGWIAYRLRRWL